MMEENIEKTKVCPIFEPTFCSINLLPKTEMRLRMFENLCQYAFGEIEPEFGNTDDEKMLEALWTQFMVAFVQSKKRAKRNAINGHKGGRPRKNPHESDRFSEENPKKPTMTSTYSYVDSSSPPPPSVDNYEDTETNEEIGVNINDADEIF